MFMFKICFLRKIKNIYVYILELNVIKLFLIQFEFTNTLQYIFFFSCFYSPKLSTDIFHRSTCFKYYLAFNIDCIGSVVTIKTIKRSNLCNSWFWRYLFRQIVPTTAIESALYNKNNGTDRWNKLSVACVIFNSPLIGQYPIRHFPLLANLAAGLDRTGRDADWPSAR